jgi:hypothetical protein
MVSAVADEFVPEEPDAVEKSGIVAAQARRRSFMLSRFLYMDMIHAFVFAHNFLISQCVCCANRTAIIHTGRQMLLMIPVHLKPRLLTK